MTDLVQLNASTWVRRGTGRAAWKNVRGRELLVVSAEMPSGKRKDIDSSLCVFLCKGLLHVINETPN